LISEDKLLIPDAIRALAAEAGRRCGWKTPTGPPKGPRLAAAPTWAWRAYHAAAARALIHDDNSLTADATLR